MSSGKPLLVVCGATGNQGGSVISHFLAKSPSPYALRGLTRDTTSAKSVALASQGVDMVKADFGDPSSLDAAFVGASAIYAITDFWVFFDNPQVREKAEAAGQSFGELCMENDAQQNKNIMDAAAKLDTLERFIYSSMANTKVLSGGKYPHCHHFDGKAVAEDYGRSAHPILWAKTTVMYAGFYLENYFGPVADLLRPKLNAEENTLVLRMDEAVASIRWPFYSVCDDTGALVDALLRAPPGKKVVGVNQWLDCREVAAIIAQVMGKKLEIINESQVIDLQDPVRTQDHLDMISFCGEFGYDGHKVDNTILQPGDLGVPVSLTPVKGWCEKQDWMSAME